MAIIQKSVMVHTMQLYGPRITIVDASATINAPRTFTGIGAPTSTTLVAGNGKYNGTGSGFPCDATLSAAGTNYAVADVLTFVGGTGTTMKITVDMVDNSGTITDYHISTLGNYSVYPTGVCTVTGGSGSGAQFYLNLPAPDYYLDITTPATPVLYVCTTSGSNSSSVWAKISGGGGLIAMYDTTGATAYSGGAIVFVASQFVLGGITVLPGTYGLLSTQSTPASPSGNQVPQIPVPTSGTIYWIPIAAGLVAASTCASGTTTQVYVNSTGAF